jgi:triacylglycerol esterase/lipase EstA (alpha/beta hydrolase family)
LLSIGLLASLGPAHDQSVVSMSTNHGGTLMAANPQYQASSPFSPCTVA